MTLILKSDTSMASPGEAPFRVPVLPVAGASARWMAETETGVYAKQWASVIDGGPTLSYTLGSFTAPTVLEVDGITALEFDGVSDGLSGLLSLPQPHSIVMVVKTTSLDSGAVQALSGDQDVPGGAIDRANIFVAGPIGSRTLRMSGGVPVIGFPPTDQWGVLTAVFNGPESVLRLDSTERVLDAGVAPREGITFGHYRNGLNFARMDLAEAVVYPFALSPSERGNLESHFRATYALTS